MSKNVLFCFVFFASVYKRFAPITTDNIRQNSGVSASAQHGVPTLKDLMEKVAVHLSYEWQQLGIQLDLDQQLLKRIELNNIRDIEGCCREMFNQWLRRELNPSWDKIIKALKTQSVDQPKLARDLEEQYTHI